MEEPSPAELYRGLELMRQEQREFRKEINTRLDRLVTTEALVGTTQATNQRIEALADDLVEESSARKEGDMALSKRLDQFGVLLRWVIAAVLVPIALFVASIVLAKGA